MGSLETKLIGFYKPMKIDKIYTRKLILGKNQPRANVTFKVIREATLQEYLEAYNYISPRAKREVIDRVQLHGHRIYEVLALD